MARALVASGALPYGLVVGLGAAPSPQQFGVAGWSASDVCAAIPGAEVAVGADVSHDVEPSCTGRETAE